MEAIEVVSSNSKQARSATCGPKPENVGPDFHHFGSDELHGLMDVPPETGSNSFTALLQLPANQAVELLVHSPVPVDPPPPRALSKLSGEAYSNHGAYAPPQPMPPPPIFPSDTALVDRAAKFSVFASSENSPESSCWKQQAVKQEPLDSDSSPAASDPTVQKPSNKRKDKEKKAKESNKKSKKAANETSAEDTGGGSGSEKLPYVHVRARRGQATDSHSLAERARREKINARMKLLQELVPGCNKISGTASVLDEIINHVQSLQRQVEFLSMRLAAVNPTIDFNLDSFLAAENESPVGSNIPSMVMPSVWPEGQINGIRPQYQQLWQLDEFQQPVWCKEENNSNFLSQNNSNFIAQETSLLSYDSSANSASLHSNQLKMEL